MAYSLLRSAFVVSRSAAVYRQPLSAALVQAQSTRAFSAGAKSLSAELSNKIPNWAHYAPESEFPGTAGYYTSLLYIVANADKKLDEVYNDLISLEKLVRNEKVFEVIEAPFLAKNLTDTFLKHALPLAKSPLTKNFIQRLARGNDLSCLPHVIEYFTKTVRSQRGEIDVVLTVAKTPDERDLNTIRRKLRREYILSSDMKPTFTLKVDPDIQGGFIASIGDTSWDYSARKESQAISKMVDERIRQFYEADRREAQAKLFGSA